MARQLVSGGPLLTIPLDFRAMSNATKAFRTARTVRGLETAEDYTELVLELGAGGAPVRAIDLSRALGVSHVTVLRCVARLQRDGLLRKAEKGGIALTARGKRLAEKSRERHRTVLEFLLALGVPERQAEIDAEGIEHHVSSSTLRCMRQFAGGGAR